METEDNTGLHKKKSSERISYIQLASLLQITNIKANFFRHVQIFRNSMTKV